MLDLNVPGNTTDWPSREEPCYDCGSTVPGHHTPRCDMAGPEDAKDLPQLGGWQTHWWAECRDAGGRWVSSERRPQTAGG